MNLDNIYEGQVVKNYKEMCLLLDEDIKTGNSKKSQTKHWENYFNYSKDGHKYIIKEIYNIPMEILELQNGYNSKYADYVKKIIVDKMAYEHLKDNNNVSITFNINNMAYYLNMVNYEYVKHKYNKAELARKLDVNESTVYDFFEKTSKTIKDSIKRSLESLKRSDIVMYNKIDVLLMVAYEDKRKTLVLEVSDDLGALFIESKQAINKKYGITEIGSIINGEYSQYMERVSKYLTPKIHELYPHVSKYYVKYVYSVYHVIFSKYILETKEKIDNYLLSNRPDEFNTLNKIMYDEALNKDNVETLEYKKLADETIVNEVDDSHVDCLRLIDLVDVRDLDIVMSMLPEGVLPKGNDFK